MCKSPLPKINNFKHNNNDEGDLKRPSVPTLEYAQKLSFFTRKKNLKSESSPRRPYKYNDPKTKESANTLDNQASLNLMLYNH